MTLANTQLVDILDVVDGHDVLFKLNDNGMTLELLNYTRVRLLVSLS